MDALLSAEIKRGGQRAEHEHRGAEERENRADAAECKAHAEYACAVQRQRPLAERQQRGAAEPFQKNGGPKQAVARLIRAPARGVNGGSGRHREQDAE